MRISRLDLQRYGKFTDKSIVLPSAARDFHLIVGPNEAGKSTLRNAIGDLLFGIETRSRYNFIHANSDMCLGALIEQGGDRLDFLRTKGRTKVLKSSDGKALDDHALTPFMGHIDRPFFDHMFGLNHERLVAGGQEILSASNDVGQILFQAAAGIASLGEVRDRLEAEADQLWAKRKSGDREYYQASAELEAAETALKLATVRTRDWQEARDQVQRISDELELARGAYQGLEQERMLLERVRRAAPMLIAISEREQRLTALGDVVLLPEKAADELANAEQEILRATQSQLLFNNQALALQEKIERLQPDAAVLARGRDISALSETRQQLRNHDNDIGKREEEIRVLWQAVKESMRQLAWPQMNEDELAVRLPGSILTAMIDDLLRREAGLAQSVLNAAEAYRLQQEEIKVFTAALAELPVAEVSVSLLDALASARALGDVAAQLARGDAQVTRQARELEALTHELGAWKPPLDRLQQLLPPSQDETNVLIKRRGDLELTAATINARLTELDAESHLLQTRIAQYQTAHSPVTLADVRQVRTARDTAWAAIKAGDLVLAAAAPAYEKVVAESDDISDRRHDKAKQETELQSLLDQANSLQQQMADLARRQQDNIEALARFDQAWDGRIQNAGLDGMPLLQVNAWRSARERVLSAAAAWLEAQESQAAFKGHVAFARTALAESMLSINPESESLTFSALVLSAEEVVNAATRAQEQRAVLGMQLKRAAASIPDLKHRASLAEVALTTWQADLQKTLEQAHLPLAASGAAIAGALKLFEAMSQGLQKIREIRSSRIDMMRRDLDAFDTDAKALAAELAPSMIRDPAVQIVLNLESQLKAALSISQELARLTTEHQSASAQAESAGNRIALAQAGLTSLLRLSGAVDNSGLRMAVENSDRARTLSYEIDQTLKQLLQAGDGQPRETLASEFNALDSQSISPRLAEIKLMLDEFVAQQNRLSSELTSARTELGKIAGQDVAARSESLRHEALARMANAVERYIKVYTAAKLLRWSIERFRESKQGPMLVRASEIFCGLTQGVFGRLVVDYETPTPKLSGQRGSGEIVEIDGMSEGTRDQLYLALRLAALELHLQQMVPLPFIADDLFINYDDGRSRAGFESLARLSEMTQVVFMTHHAHLIPVAQSVFGVGLSVTML